MHLKYFIIIIYMLSCNVGVTFCEHNKTLLIFAVTTDITDAYLLYVRSLHTYGLKVQKIFANGQKYIGHSLKVNLLAKELENYKDRRDVIVLFTDSYDVIFTAGEKEIIRAFEAFDANIVFSAETNCAPVKRLASHYPEAPTVYKFLNSGGFIGYAPDLFKLLPTKIPEFYDDQLYYALNYLNETTRASYGMVLDYYATIFQSMHEAADHVSFVYTDDDTKLHNHYTNTTPLIIHGNGNGKYLLHTFSSYLAKSWTISKGCLSCDEGRINLENMTEMEYPKVLMGVFVDRPTPFLEEKLNKISRLLYPKKRIFLFVYNKIAIHNDVVRRWISDHENEYLDTNYLLSAYPEVTQGRVRILAIKTCLNVSCDLYFSIDSEVNIENPNTLNLLVSYNRTVIAPVMMEPGTSRSTFWGAMSDDEKFTYVESFDYQNIISNNRSGIWNVPQVWNIYLVKNKILKSPNIEQVLFFQLNPDVGFSWISRITKNFSMFLYATNLEDYGHLSNMDLMPQDALYGDLWQVASNSKDWENKYLHPQYYKQLDENFTSAMICPDVFVFPLLSERFCREMIETVEQNRDQFSNGENKDLRLYSAFEYIPSVDIHMNQIGYEKEWSHIVQQYVKPFVEKGFKGHDSKGHPISSFVVRYDIGANQTMEPHYDSSTYTINVVLSRNGTDYQGGGTNFLRYNCSVENVPVGWAIIHPGRLTHIHKTLKLTNGKKYNLISFVDS